MAPLISKLFWIIIHLFQKVLYSRKFFPVLYTAYMLLTRFRKMQIFPTNVLNVSVPDMLSCPIINEKLLVNQKQPKHLPPQKQIVKLNYQNKKRLMHFLFATHEPEQLSQKDVRNQYFHVWRFDHFCIRTNDKRDKYLVIHFFVSPCTTRTETTKNNLEGQQSTNSINWFSNDADITDNDYSVENLNRNENNLFTSASIFLITSSIWSFRKLHIKD